MKNLAIGLLSFLAVNTVSAQIQLGEEIYNAAKFFIVDTTKARIDAFVDSDSDTGLNVKTICNATNVLTGSSEGRVDTKSYYLAFELLEDESFITQLSKDVGQFAVSNYISMSEEGLPYQLHDACVNEDKEEILKVMIRFYYLSIQE